MTVPSMSVQAAPDATRSGPTEPAAARVALEYDVTGELRFLSHHDELRMLTRALVRARWPLAWSHGFSPRPRLVVPLPGSVGMAADAQLALVNLEQPCRTEELRGRLAAVLPADCILRRVTGARPRVVLQAQRVHYVIEIERHDVALAEARLPGLLAARSLLVKRGDGSHQAVHTLDVRRFVQAVELEGALLRLSLAVEGQQSARPSEILEELGLDRERYGARVRRVAVQWNIEFAGPG